MKKLLITLLGIILPLTAYAAKGLDPVTNQTLQSIAGVDDDGDIIGVLVDADGNLSVAVSASVNAPTNGSVNLPSNGATARVQLTALASNSCTLQAPIANTAAIYVGGSTVTNAAGANEGIKLVPGDTFGPITVTNLNTIYASTDTNNDDVKYLCN